MSDRIRVSLQPRKVEMEPDSEPREVVLAVQNVADYVDQFSVELEGLGPGWYTLPVNSVSLFPQDRDEVRIKIHPRKEEGARAGVYPFRVRVTSRSQPTESTVAEGELSMRAYAVFAAEIAPPTRVACRRKADFKVRVINRGNVDIALTPKAVDREEACRFDYQPLPLKVRACTPPPTLDLRLTARPQRSFWVGPAKTYDFTLTLTPEGAKGEAKTLTAQVVHRPLLPSWRPVIHWARRLVILVILLAASLFGWRAVELEGGFGALPTTAGRWVGQARVGLQDLLGIPRDQLAGTPVAPGKPAGAAGPAPSLPSGAAASAATAMADVFGAIFKAEPQLVGEPVEPSRQDKDGNVTQTTKGGVLLYWKQFDRVYLFSNVKGAVYEFRGGRLNAIAVP